MQSYARQITTLKKKKTNLWEILLVMAFLFAMPLRVYIPTSFIIELTLVVLLVFVTRRKGTDKIVKDTDYSHIFFLLLLLVFGIAQGTTNPPFFTESYRYFTFFLFLTILKMSNVSYVNLLKLCFWACAFCSFFSIFELIHLNIFHFGEYDSVIILGPASASMYSDAESDYLSQQWFLGLPYFRPMGFFIQPQKSGFIPVIGTICHYLLNINNRGKGYWFWYIFFTSVVIASAAKTAVASQLLIIAVAVLNLYPRKNLKSKELLQIVFISIPVVIYAVSKLFVGNHAEETAGILNDMFAFFNYPFINWFIGIGIPENDNLLAHGFSCECYLARLLAQVGVLFFMIELIWGYSIIRSKSKKFNWILISLLFGVFSHYCLINAYFMTFSISVIICYTQTRKRQELE